MKRTIITLGAALLAAVPAAAGFIGNASFAEGVSVRVPAHAVVVPAVADDRGGQGKHTEAGDDKGGRLATRTTEINDDKGGHGKHTEAGDDKGGSGKGRSGKGGG